MDIFFVISGLIMGTIGVNERPLVFLCKRIIRIAPLYWLFTFVMCLGAIAGVYSQFSFNAETLTKSLFFIPYWDQTGHVWPLMVVGWTLNLEMFFYIIFAAAIFLGRPILFTSLALASMVILGYTFDLKNAALNLWSSNLLLEFIAGLLLSRFVLPGKISLIAVILGVSGLAASNVFSLFDPEYRILVWGIPAFLIVAGCLSLEKRGYWPSAQLKPIQLIGDASYSLYLSHVFWTAAVHKFFGNAFLPSAIGLIVAVVCAIAIFRLVEKPLLKSMKPLVSRLPA